MRQAAIVLTRDQLHNDAAAIGSSTIFDVPGDMSLLRRN
jgi:hypothetical protein